MSERRVDVSTAPMDVAARETNKVLRNTYMLRHDTAFSAMTATISMVLQLPTYVSGLRSGGLRPVVCRQSNGG